VCHHHQAYLLFLLSIQAVVKWDIYCSEKEWH
jgi:hypothetical protein